MLYSNQKKISSDIYYSLDKKELFNVPTGAGKTFIILDVAKKVIKDKLKVIISTPTNHLVRDMYSTAINNKFFDNEISIKIGNSNYIDRSKLYFHINSGIIFDYIDNSKEELEIFMDQSEDLYFDLFDEFVKYKDVAMPDTVRNLLCKTQIEESTPFNQVTITNHFYLLSKIMYDKFFDLSEYVVLVDEVHQLNEIAEAILTHTFSIYEFKNTFYSLRKEVSDMQFTGKETLLRNIQTLNVRASNLLSKYSIPDNTGNYIKGYENNKDCFDNIDSMLKSREYVNTVKKIESFSKENKLTNFSKYINRINNYHSNINSLKQKNNSCGIYYSPSRGYPCLNITISNPQGVLNKAFISKIKKFAGLSATITCGFKPSTLEIKYGYERLGMIEKDRKDYVIHFYDRVFPKEFVKIHLPDNKNNNFESIYSEDFDENNSEYYNNILKTIYETHQNKNSLILCGGYKEAKYLHDTYCKRYKSNVPLDYAKPSEKTFQTVSRFKQQGGLLFAVRNYNTGLSLEGEMLENLYILKFPFVDFTTKKWQEIKENSSGMFFIKNEREMLIALMQTLGRLQRTKNDKGNIYILDGKYHKFPTSRKENIKAILREYGILVENDKKSTSKKVPIIELESELERLLGL